MLSFARAKHDCGCCVGLVQRPDCCPVLEPGFGAILSAYALDGFCFGAMEYAQLLVYSP